MYVQTKSIEFRNLYRSLFLSWGSRGVLVFRYLKITHLNTNHSRNNKFEWRVLSANLLNCKDMFCSNRTKRTTSQCPRTQHKLDQYLGRLGCCSYRWSKWNYTYLYGDIQFVTWRHFSDGRNKCFIHPRHIEGFEEIHKV